MAHKPVIVFPRILVREWAYELFDLEVFPVVSRLLFIHNPFCNDWDEMVLGFILMIRILSHLLLVNYNN